MGIGARLRKPFLKKREGFIRQRFFDKTYIAVTSPHLTQTPAKLVIAIHGCI